MGRPKGVVEIEGEALAARATARLLAGGCADVLVVLGAAGDEVRSRLPAEGPVASVTCPDWQTGMGASLRTGLVALAARGRRCPRLVLVHLVDLPDVTVDVVLRVLDRERGTGTLARAAYAGEPGHPVLIGQQHWQPIMESAVGDRGARWYLRSAAPDLVECGDLATGRDADVPADLGD